MMRIILTLVLFCLPLWSHNIDAIQQQKALKKPIVSIAVTSPTDKDSWMINNSYTIRWNKFGQMPNTVRIILSNREGTARVALIKDSAPNTGSFQWTIPESIPPGTYRIGIRVLNTEIRDLSDEFSITRELKAREKSIISIAITSPKANAPWLKKKAYAIKWNKFGQMPGTVQIILSNREGTATVAVIKDSAPNTGSFQWTIPESIPQGTYKIMVRASNTNISDLSDEFRIYDELKAMPVDLSSRRVIVTKPQENRKYTPGLNIPINWETELHKRILNTNNMLYFDIEICNADSHNPVFAFYKKERYDKFYQGGNKYSMDFKWMPDMSKKLRTGFYKIRITPNFADGPAGMPGFSGKFHLSRGTEKVTVDLSPQIRDRRSTRREGHSADGSVPPPPMSRLEQYNRDSQPGTARVGFVFKRTDPEGGSIFYEDWVYMGIIYRSQITFPVEQYMGPGKLLLKATLRLTVEDSALDGKRVLVTGYPVPNTCGRNIYYLTSPWSGNCLSTPGYQIATLSDQLIEFDVTQYVQNWYTGSEPNHGFLLGSILEEFKMYPVTADMASRKDINPAECVTWYKPVLVLEFLQEKD